MTTRRKARRDDKPRVRGKAAHAASPKARPRSRSGKRATRPARPFTLADGVHLLSPTAVAAAALRTGISPVMRQFRKGPEIPHEDVTMRAGDPDGSGLTNEYVGEELPGASTPTPDQNDVDEIGRAYGVQEEDAGELRTSSELMSRRDRRRSELKAPRRPRP